MFITNKKVLIVGGGVLLLGVVCLVVWLLLNNSSQRSSEIEISAFLDRFELKPMNIIKVDINENGIADYIVEAMPKECGSCHSRPFYIIENGKVLLEYNGDDYVIKNIDYISNNELTIKEPVRIEGEAMCCPSQYKETIISCPKLVGIAYCYIKDTYESPDDLVKAMLDPNREKGMLEKSFK